MRRARIHKTMMSPCGVDCSICEFYGDTCAGCREIEGNVYWAQYVGADVCPLYHCCITKKKLEDCGECNALPCHIYYDTQDPSITKEEHEAGIKLRVDNLKNYRDQTGTIIE